MSMYATDGTLIKNAGGKVNNDSEVKIQQITADFNAFKGAGFYGDGSTVWYKKTRAELDAQWLTNGWDNLWLKKEGNVYTEAKQFDMTFLFWPELAKAYLDEFGTGGNVMYDVGELPAVDANGYIVYTG